MLTKAFIGNVRKLYINFHVFIWKICNISWRIELGEKSPHGITLINKNKSSGAS